MVAIVRGRKSYPAGADADAVALCDALMAPRPGARPQDLAALQQLGAFRELDWDGLAARQLPPPFVPSAAEMADGTLLDPGLEAADPAPPDLPAEDESAFVAFDMALAAAGCPRAAFDGV